MNSDQQQNMRDYAWNYFSQHSEQRLKSINFYIMFCTVVIGGFATIISRNPFSVKLIFLPFLLIFFSFVFWKLDQRTRVLIKAAEEALKHLDAIVLSNEPEEAKVLSLFFMDDKRIKLQNKYPLLSGHFSYTRVFNWLFGAMSLIGVAGCVACILS